MELISVIYFINVSILIFNIMKITNDASYIIFLCCLQHSEYIFTCNTCDFKLVTCEELTNSVWLDSMTLESLRIQKLHSIVIDWLVIIVIKMDRNSRENGPTDININLRPWIKELVSLEKNMCSKRTCYLGKLEHRLAQRRF